MTFNDGDIGIKNFLYYLTILFYSIMTDFYDIVFKVDSFSNLKKKEQGDYGWDILYSKDFDYSKRTKEELVRIGVVGNGNSGKSFILSKLTKWKVPSGFSIKTEGIFTYDIRPNHL